jgi:hypothetical protein
LVLRISARDGSGNGQDYIYAGITFNSDTTTKYSATYILSDSTTAQTYSQSYANTAGSSTSTLQFLGTGSTATANTFGSAEIYIPNYQSTIGKPFSSYSTAESNATSPVRKTMLAGLYQGTSGITSIAITTGLFATNSSFYLYGISNA